MNAPVLVAIISAAVALTTAVMTYSFSKKNERESQWRKLKLDHYKEFVSALSGVVSQRSTVDSKVRYADAVNLMSLVAPPPVLRALYQFQDATNPNKSAHLTALLGAIREDVHPRNSDDTDLTFRLMDAPGPGDESDGRGLPLT